VRIAGLCLILLIVISACSTDETLPTQLNLPAPTKTLIPTQSQGLTTPTLRDANPVDAASVSTDSPESDTTSSESISSTPNPPTDTPVDCNLQDEWFEYTVQRGDNLVGIANRTGSTVDELSEANCLDNPNQLRAGQTLYVPNDPSPDRTSTPSATATIDASPQVSVNPTVRTPSISASLKKTYNHEKGFGFDYPADWFVTESQTSTVDNILITSFEYTAGVEIPQNRWTDEMVSITMTVFEEPTTTSLADWTQDVVAQFQSAANISEVFLPETFQTRDGLDGQYIDYVTNDDVVIRNYYFIIDSHQVQVNIGGNLELAVPVINSFTLES